VAFLGQRSLPRGCTALPVAVVRSVAQRELPLEPRPDSFPELLSDPVRYGSPRVFPNQEDQSKEVIVRWVVVFRVPTGPAGAANDVVQIAERDALSFGGGE